MATVDELESKFRFRFADQNSKKFQVSSADFKTWLNEAQNEACFRSNLIFDRTSSFCTIDVTASVAAYELDPIAYAIRHARFIPTDMTASTLTLIDIDALDTLRPDWRDEAAGWPRYLLISNNIVELVPAPVTSGIIKLDLYRTGEKLTSGTASPEINPMFHEPLLEWVLYRAKSLPDENALNPRAAGEHYTEFERVFGPRVIAKDYQDQHMDRPHRVKATFI
jgi:hypothetical protein